MLKYIFSIITIFICTSSYAQSWLDVFNRYRVAQASDWLTPTKIVRTDLRPFVTLARRNQPCLDCRMENLGDSGRFALAMQGQGSRKSAGNVRSKDGETLLTNRDMEFLRMHAWDGSGKIFIGATLYSPQVSPQSLLMAMVTQLGVRGRPLAIGLNDTHEDLLLWAYRLLPLVENDISAPVVRDGKLVYPVQLRFNVYFHESIEDPSLEPFDFLGSRDQSYPKRTRVGRYTSAQTLKAQFVFDQPVSLAQNGYRAEGNGRLLDTGSWSDGASVTHLWVATSYGASASEHPALTPKALNLIEAGNWNAPELTKRLTTDVTLNGAFDAYPWLASVSDEKHKELANEFKDLMAKKIDHAFYRAKIAAKVWPLSINVPKNSNEKLSLRITFYGNYDQLKTIKVFESMGLVVDFSNPN